MNGMFSSVSFQLFLPVGSLWRSDLSCALDVGRELSRVHFCNAAEANSMPSRRRLVMS